jgi:astacin (peptidase family M12A)
MIRKLVLTAAPIMTAWAGGAYGAVAVADRGRLWQDHVVLFAICETVSSADESQPATSGCDQGGDPLSTAEAAKVRAAVEQWNALFGDELRFVRVDGLRPSQRGVLFSQSKREFSCSTDQIGRPKFARRTSVKIGSRCNRFASAETPVGTVLHEMMHVAGFYHEQQRPDRNAYLQPHVPHGFVNVLFDVGGAGQWAKGGNRMRMLTRYDFGSIMHYPIRDPHKATITPEGRQRLEAEGLSMSDPGRRDAMSQDDIAGIKLLYGKDPGQSFAASKPLAKVEPAPL